MEMRRIGALEVSAVGLGCNNFGGRLDSRRTAEVVGAALDAGVTFFDTADIYGGTRSEEHLGQALGRRRDEVVIATKFGFPYQGHEGGAAPDYVRRAAEESLRRLGTDHIDLYQLHAPDRLIPIADTLGALGELVGAGKVRQVGCSNFTAAQLREAAGVSGDGGGDGGGDGDLGARARFVSVQNHYNLLHREPEAEVLAECERQGIAFLPYFPLANGLLTGKYRAGEPPPEGTRIAGMPAQQAATALSPDTMEKVDALAALARDDGRSLLELAVAWLLSRPSVTSVIAGATTPGQVRANAAAAVVPLDADLLARIDAIAPA
jgi:aryl-alcohol dehydrogenase-like predicted oxidoreductase